MLSSVSSKNLGTLKSSKNLQYGAFWQKGNAYWWRSKQYFPAYYHALLPMFSAVYSAVTHRNFHSPFYSAKRSERKNLLFLGRKKYSRIYNYAFLNWWFPYVTDITFWCFLGLLSRVKICISHFQINEDGWAYLK